MDNMEHERNIVYVPPPLVPVMSGYLDNRLADVIRLQKGIIEGDFQALWRIGHGMKGSGSTYGMPAITRIGADIERFAAEEDTGSLKTVFTELISFLDTIEVVYPDQSADDGL